MPFTSINNLQVFQFNNLSHISWIKHGISTKTFGSISGEKAHENRKKFFSAVGIQEKDVVETKQVHSNHVYVTSQKDRGTVILDRDALITNEVQTALFVKSADCVPILLVDTEKKIIAAIHAGWRGTVEEIVKLTINHMEDHLGSNPRSVIAGIGPSIGPCCYEVDTPVIRAFEYQFKSNAQQFFSQRTKNHVHLNLWEANRFQLIERGVLAKNIEIAKICTFDRTDLFFSERKEGKSGRFAAVIAMR